MTVAIGFARDTHHAVRLYLVPIDPSQRMYRLACDTACGWGTWATASPVIERRGIAVTCGVCSKRMNRTERRAA